MTFPVPTAQFASLVHGSSGVSLDDPAEAFHEHSRLYPNIAPPQLTALLGLAESGELDQTVARSSRSHPHRPGVDLPVPTPIGERLLDAVERRCSRRADVQRPILSADLAAVLALCHRAVDRPGRGYRRPIPSGGALYPLEVYAVVNTVIGVAPGVYHYDPFGHRLALIGTASREAVAASFVDPALPATASVVLVVTAMFWRTRCKYGSRGYRFALIEAGHLAQNALLAAAALDLPALPVGGFHDRLVDRLVGANSLDEATLYTIVLGGGS